MDERLEKAKEYIVDKFELPKEVMMNLPRIIILGKEEITIENHKGILSFNSNLVKINSGIGSVIIEGKNFEILFMGGSTLTIGGKFKSIMYEDAYNGRN